MLNDKVYMEQVFIQQMAAFCEWANHIVRNLLFYWYINYANKQVHTCALGILGNKIQILENGKMGFPSFECYSPEFFAWMIL